MLARLLCTLLALTFAADGVTRAFPIDWLAFRPWEALQHDKPADAPFEPSRRFECSRCYGDLANMANLPQYRIPRREVFTTDSWGFRNQPSVSEKPVRVLLTGDSFAAGASLTDADTLAERLSERIHAGVYNSAPMPIDAEALNTLARRLRMTNGVLLIQQLGWGPTIYPPSYIPHEQPPVTASDRFIASFRQPLFPLRILANQFVRFFQDDVILANPYQGLALVEELANGEPMLFRQGEVNMWTRQHPGPEHYDNLNASALAYYRQFQEKVAPSGLRVAVLLVPHKFTVYRPFLRSTPPDTRTVDAYFGRLADALNAAGIIAIDPSEAFFVAAESGLRTKRPIYWPDDTHWDPDGVAIAVDLIGAALDAATEQQ